MTAPTDHELDDLDKRLRVAHEDCEPNGCTFAAVRAAITALRAERDALRRERDVMLQLLYRIAAWDMMDSSADGKYWRQEIALAVAQLHEGE